MQIRKSISHLKDSLRYHLRSSKEVEEIEDQLSSLAVVFILGTGRTGTNFFESFLNAHWNSVLCRHEPAPDNFDLMTRFIRKKIEFDQVRSEFLVRRGPLIKQAIDQGKSLYVESNPNVTFLAPQLVNIFPHAKVVHIVRHPSTYIRSAINKSPLDDGNLFMTDNDHRTRVNADDIPNDPWFGKWSEMSQFERVCWHWRYTNIFLRDYFQGNEAYVRFKFEDIFNGSNLSAMTALLEFMGLSIAAKDLPAISQSMQVKRNQTQTTVVNERIELTTENHKFSTDIVDHTLLDLFGY